MARAVAEEIGMKNRSWSSGRDRAVQPVAEPVERVDHVRAQAAVQQAGNRARRAISAEQHAEEGGGQRAARLERRTASSRCAAAPEAPLGQRAGRWLRQRRPRAAKPSGGAHSHQPPRSRTAPQPAGAARRPWSTAPDRAGEPCQLSPAGPTGRCAARTRARAAHGRRSRCRCRAPVGSPTTASAAETDGPGLDRPPSAR